LTMHELTIRDFLQKRSNPQKPKECRIYLRVHTRCSAKWFLSLWLSRTLCGASFTTSNDQIFAIQQAFSEIPEMVLKNVFTNWIMRLSCVIEKGGECAANN
jgi:hypothetical protein